MTEAERASFANFGSWLESSSVAERLFGKRGIETLAPKFKAVEQGGPVTKAMTKAYDEARDLFD